MSSRFFIFRPEPGWSETAARARDMGLKVSGNPLFTIEPCDWAAPDPEQFDAILAGSPNAFRHGGSALAKLRTLPVLAVGKATANEAEKSGFEVAKTGEGGLQGLIDSLPQKPMRLLRLCGEARVTLKLPVSLVLEERILYRAISRPISNEVAGLLARGGIAALHSAEAARMFAREIERVGVNRNRITLVLIGPRLQEVVGTGWKSIYTAAKPSDAALLALVRDVCNQS